MTTLKHFRLRRTRRANRKHCLCLPRLAYHAIESLTPILYLLTYNSLSSPNIERLLQWRWNDDCCFYGDTNSYMVKPKAPKDKRLLATAEARLRGLCTPSAISVNEEDDDHQVDSEDVSDEDMFLSNDAPAFLSSLASYLRKACQFDEMQSVRYMLSKKKALARLESYLSTFRYKLYAVDKERWSRMFVRGLDRPLDPMLYQSSLLDVIDHGIFLDYMPLLRTICYIEESMDRFRQGNGNRLQEPVSERAMRSMKRQGEQTHYLYKVIPEFAIKDNVTPEEVGRQIGQKLLSAVRMV